MRGIYRIIATALTVLLSVHLFSGVLAGQSSIYRTHPQVVDNGGGKPGSERYQLRASIAQHVLGPSANLERFFYAGYLYGADARPSPKTDKGMAIARLENVKTLIPEGEWEQVNQATAKVQESLTPLWWLDPWHLNQDWIPAGSEATGSDVSVQPARASVESAGAQSGLPDGERGEERYGEKVFEKEAEAAWKIKGLTKKPYPPDAIAELIASARDIMDADSVLAQVKIVEAELSGGNPQELEKAYREMEKAEQEKNKPDPAYDRVVEHYGQAWLHAVNAEEMGPVLAGIQTTGVGDHRPVFALGKPYPNPTRTGTTIRYGVASECLVNLRIYDVTGRAVRTLTHEKKKPGYYVCQWDCGDEDGSSVANGTYIYRLDAGPFTAARKVTVLK
jgi:hypothetical protein